MIEKARGPVQIGQRRCGFTFIELLVVISIICILVALLLPAVQQAREAARRTVCKSHLMQLGIALQNYHDAFEMFPAGTVNPTGPVLSEPSGYHRSWIIAILPYLEQRALAEQFHEALGVYDPLNDAARAHVLEVLRCPSDSGPTRASGNGGNVGPGMTNFAGCHHPLEAPIDANNWGTLFLNSYLDYSDLVDGSARTLLVGEFLRADDQLGWASGTRSTLRNTGVPINRTPRGPVAGRDYQALADGLAPAWSDAQTLESEIVQGQARARSLTPPYLPEFVGGYGSEHLGGAQFLLADGAVRFISENIATGLYQRLGHRADGAMIDEF